MFQKAKLFNVQLVPATQAKTTTQPFRLLSVISAPGVSAF